MLWFFRFVNIIKIVFSFIVSRIIRRPIVWGMPLSLMLEPTNHCNLKCPACPSGTGELTRSLGNISVDNFKVIIDAVYKKTSYLIFYFQGEPYVNKHLPEMISYARSKKMYVLISTNGLLFNEKNIKSVLENAPSKLVFSIDGLDEETYQNYRVGGTFEKAKHALKLLTDEKKKLNLKKPVVEMQFIVMKQNQHFVSKVKEFGREMGVDKVVLKSMQVYSHHDAVNYLPDDEKYRRYTVTGDDFKIKSKLKNHCFSLWKTLVLTWDGNVVPCCFDKDSIYKFGNVKNQSLEDLWKGKAFNNFRNAILLDRKGIDICNNCTQGLSIKILEK